MEEELLFLLPSVLIMTNGTRPYKSPTGTAGLMSKCYTFSRTGGFLGPIGHFERKRAVISIVKCVELDERNPPLHDYNHLPIKSSSVQRYPNMTGTLAPARAIRLSTFPPSTAKSVRIRCPSPVRTNGPCPIMATTWPGTASLFEV